MTTRTAKLYYPNRTNMVTMTLYVNDLAEYTINDFNSKVEFTLPEETILKKLTVLAPKDKLVGSIAIVPKIYNKSDLRKTNLIPTPFKDQTKTVNKVQFIVGNSLLIIDGKAENADALFTVFENLTLDAGTYVLTWGDKIDYHSDVFFSNKFHNAMVMSNEDTDGIIWQVKHRPNNYILYCGSYSDSTHGTQLYSKLIYPKDKYAIYPGVNIAEGWSRSKHYIIQGGGYAYGQDSRYTIGDNTGRHILRKNILGPAIYKGSWSRVDDTGIIINYASKSYPDANKVYLATIENNDIKFRLSDFQMPSNAGFFETSNGVIFYTIPGSRELYYIDSNGGHGNTGLEGDFPNHKFHCYGYSGQMVMTCWRIFTQGGVQRYLRWAHIFSRGSYSGTIGAESFPGYGNPSGGVFILYYFDGHYKVMVDRYDAFQKKWVYDCWDYGPDMSSSPTIKSDTYKPVRVPAVGWKTPDYRNSYYGGMDQDGYVTINIASPYFDPNVGSRLYFKDGVITEAFDYILAGWNPYNNRMCLAVIQGDGTEPPKEEPFMFDALYTDYLDHHNITWKRKW